MVTLSFVGGALAGGPASAATPAAGQLAVIAGNGAGGPPTEGTATNSELYSPLGVAVDGSGNVYIADTVNNVVEKVSSSGALSVIAGNIDGVGGPPTPGAATDSELDYPTGVAVDGSGNVYIADSGNNVVEEVSSSGALSVIAGNIDGDDGLPTPGTATNSALADPEGVAVDGSGNVYIADSYNNVVEKVSSSGILSVIAGNIDGDAGPPTPGTATNSDLNFPTGVAVDGSGNVYIADSENNVVEEVSSSGALSVIAGDGGGGPPTPGPATDSALYYPTGVAVDGSGNVYIADSGNNVVEEVSSSGALSVIAGNIGGGGEPPTPGTATNSALYDPTEVAVDGSADVYIADSGNNVVEEVGASAVAPAFTADSPPGATIGTAYSYTFTASGYPAPTFSSTGALPAGLTLNTTSGALSGTPTGSGTFTVTATNATDSATTASITITATAAPTVVPPPTVPVPTLPPVTAVPTVAPVPTVPPVPAPVLVPTGGGAAATPNGAGYWALAPGGDLSDHGNAANFGSEDTANLNAPIVAVGSTTTGQGYWLAGADGGVFNFGDARFFGSLGGTHLDGPIVAMSPTADNGGYLLAGADGGVFAFGDATFAGSMAGAPLNRAITSMVPVPGGKGYWLAGADGGVFSFGGARFYGSLGATDIDRRIVGMAATPDGKGYWLVGANGAVTAFGDARSFGSLPASSTTRIVGIVADGNVGYRLITAQGSAVAFGTTPAG